MPLFQPKMNSYRLHIDIYPENCNKHREVKLVSNNETVKQNINHKLSITRKQKQCSSLIKLQLYPITLKIPGPDHKE